MPCWPVPGLTAAAERARRCARRADGPLASQAMPKRTRLLVVVLTVLALGGTACGQSNDPASWSEAHEDGNLEENYMKACSEANAGGAVEFSDSQRAAYCRCSFRAAVEYYGGVVDADGRLSDHPEPRLGRDFEAFRQLENDLRDEPEDLPADLEVKFNDCTEPALST